MVAVKEILHDSLAASIGEWFEPSFSHPFLNIKVIVVPDAVKPIPQKWVNDVELDEFGAEMGDIMGEGPVLFWSVEERKQRLQLALKRLDLNEELLVTKKIVKMSRSELSHEKKRVKQELKKYDTDWRRQFKVLPNHAQKEVMRPLYIYYRKLKQALGSAESAIRGAGDDSDDDNPEQPDDDGTSPKNLRSGKNKGRRGEIENQIAILEARVNTLHPEKGMVRTKLREFQERFVIEHHRKIKFHKDILPIEREYRMYKNIKDEIAKVEGQLRALRDGLA
mmetsp:Transcript_42584/g.76942  ORF Transcript_42584/g.76942 Transcript_42584/m.76942 type:complete len:279 (-) Transcript_42584:160-996(-)